MSAAANEYYQDLIKRLKAAPHGKRRELVTNAAQLLRVSPQSVYRALGGLGWKSGRKVRADKGTTCVDDTLARLAAGMVATARRANGKKTLPLTVARQILADNGRGAVNPETGEVFMPSASTLAKIMYRTGCHPEQLKTGSPAQELRSLHPNWSWQIDASVCVVFYLPKGEVRIFDEAKNYKNKPQNLEKTAKARVIRWVITDHYSGALFLRYTLGAEDAAGVIEVSIEAMCKREAEGDLMYGVPVHLMSDKGSGIDSALAKSLFVPLGINLIPHATGNPRAKGQVEQAQNLVETQFEGRLRMYTITSLEQLNAAADAWRIAFNGNAQHSRHGMTRNAMWLNITEEQLRVPASRDALRDLVGTTPETVKVPQNLVLKRSLKGYGPQSYELRYLPGIMPKMEISVQVNPYRAPCVDVTLTAADGAQSVFTLEPLERDRAGFRVDAPVVGEEMRAMPDTAVDVAVKAVQKEAYAAPTLKEAQKARDKNQRAYADLDPMADVKAARVHTYIPKRGRDLGLDSSMRELQPVSLVDAAITLRGELPRHGLQWSPECMAYLKERFHDSVPGEAMQTLAGEIAAHFMRPAAKVTEFPALRVAVGGAV